MRQVLLAVFFSMIVSAVSCPGVAADRNAVILTIDGGVDGGRPVEFTLDRLEALGTATIKTSTPWHDGVVTFEGVPLSRLMTEVKATGSVLAVLALNNYRTEIPFSDFGEFGAILATKANGKYMEVSDKGPLFVIYPFDDRPELKQELYYSRSAWQVRTITVE